MKASKTLAIPYVVWVLVFTIIPLALVVFFAMTDSDGNFTLDNLFQMSDYMSVLFRSIIFAIIATVVCLVIAFPAAYIISRAQAMNQSSLIILIMVPMWISFLLRTYAWMTLLEPNGLINKLFSLIGLGPFGRELITKLVDSGEKVIACDKRQDRVDKVLKLTKTTHVVDGYDKVTLKKLGFDKCDMVVVCITQSVDISVLTVMTLLNIGVKRVIAKAMSTEHAEVVSKLGAETVYPERDMAIRLANKLQVDAGIDYVELGESINISKIAVPQVFVGKSVIEASVRARFGVNIIAIEISKIQKL